MQHLMRRIVPIVVLAGIATAAGAAEYSTYTGAALYQKFCASCHGTGAHGDGPLAAALKKQPADLTLIAARYGGFPGTRIEEVIDGRVAIDAHGPSAMPVWGEEFTRSQSGKADAERESRAVIHKIVEYLRTLQRVK
jgi:mono/diheme cytochrome c family protein